MTHATSPFLNKPLRSESQATAAIEHAAELSRDERRRRLDDHGAVFCRTILDGAFERVYQPDGSYTLREFQSSATRENQALDEARSHVQAGAMPDLPEPGGSDAVARSGYAVALRDLSGWVAKAAAEPAMDATTLSALNREIARLSHAMETAPIAGR